MGASLVQQALAAVALPVAFGAWTGAAWLGLPATRAEAGKDALRPPAASLVLGRSSGDPSLASHRLEERHYRVNGKVRLLLFWTGRDDVGSARLRWEADGEASALTLLAGSNPDRAPNRLNQWIYLREETRAGEARVFALRSITDAESAADPSVAVLDGPQFGASCTALTPSAVRTAATTVTATTGLTASRLAWVLEQFETAPRWTAKKAARPSGTEAGFLTALERLLAGPPPVRGEPPPSVAYFYNNTTYDLMLARAEDRGPETLDDTTFPVLRTADLVVRNRVTRNLTRFAVTYVPAAACGEASRVTLPVRIVYQPNWWLKVELRLDRAADLPADPASEQHTLARIQHLCARATE